MLAHFAVLREVARNTTAATPHILTPQLHTLDFDKPLPSFDSDSFPVSLQPPTPQVQPHWSPEALPKASARVISPQLVRPHQHDCMYCDVAVEHSPPETARV